MKTYILRNNRLEIHVSIPGDDYNRTRFDRLGMIDKVILDSRDTFAGVESPDEAIGSGGKGLFNEFGIEDPIGYNDIHTGEQFLKIGVGALTKISDGNYDFFEDYPCQSFQSQVREYQNTIILSQDTPEVNGYAVRYEKHITITDNNLTIDYYLENTGQKKLCTTEYCHNFVTINDNDIGPDYEVTFSYPLAVDITIGTCITCHNHLTWDKALDETLYLTQKELPDTPNQHFTVRHKPSGVAMKESHNFRLHKIALWAMPHVVSPEAFFKIDLKPGESCKWQRRYTFYRQ